jgi:cell division protein FtsL
LEHILEKRDIFYILLIILFFFSLLLVVHIQYTALVYKFNNAEKNFLKLTKENKSLKIEYNNLSSPDRIIDYATKNLGLELPKANKVYFIEKN